MRLKLKQMMAVSLSVAMLLAVAPGEAVFANVKQDNIVNTKLMSGDTEKSGGGSEASEYGNLVVVIQFQVLISHGASMTVENL